MKNAVTKYLTTYAESETALLQDFPKQLTFEHAVAIPCFDETTQFISRLNTTPFAVDGPILILLVVNQAVGVTCQNNLDILRFFDGWDLLWQQQHLRLLISSEKHYWLVVDRCTVGIEKREGVGLARKIAADIALFLWHEKQIKTPWLRCTDADAHLPINYFLALPEQYSAAVFEYHHLQEYCHADVARATHLYEQALRYYVNGLQWAGSPYGFPTIGSSLAVNLLYYAQVRGFPKRSAGEDFYLLNKLAKLQPIKIEHNIVVNIESRVSHRVPFGTGPSVEKILTLEDPSRDYLYYAPECFIQLKLWIDAFPSIIADVHAGMNPCSRFDGAMRAAIDEFEFDRFAQHLIKQKLSGTNALAAFHRWFDGFQTLKWIRYFQDHFFPAQPLLLSLKNAPF